MHYRPAARPRFRYYSVADSVPSKDDHDFALRIDGLVDRPRTYTLPNCFEPPSRSKTGCG
jgi:DMSO/TMAO reductase YedYZ molybdopterin-dependent catalytic subunit